MTKLVPPQLGISSFSCPHCGAFTHQTWFRLFLDGFDKGETPTLAKYDAVARVHVERMEDKGQRERLSKFIERLQKNTITYRVLKESRYSNREVVNAWLSLCYTCDGFAVWVDENIVYPLKNSEVAAHDDMPGDVRADFNEAASIANQSPRGAAALLRLAIQKLMPHLNQKGKRP
jgi:hypothetical protein